LLVVISKIKRFHLTKHRVGIRRFYLQ